MKQDIFGLLFERCQDEVGVAVSSLSCALVELELPLVHSFVYSASPSKVRRQEPVSSRKGEHRRDCRRENPGAEFRKGSVPALVASIGDLSRVFPKEMMCLLDQE